MKESDIIRTVTVKGQAQGVAETTAAVKGLKTEMAALGQAANATATATENSARRQLSAVDAMDRMERKVSAVARAQYDFERAQRSLNMAISQNPGLQDRANQVLDVYVQKLNAVRTAQEAAARARSPTSAQNIDVRMGIGVTDFAGSAQKSAEAFLAEFGGIEGMAKAKAMEIGQAFGANLNASLITGISKSAKESASVFAEEFDRLDAITSQKAAQFGKNFQDDLNRSFNFGSVGKSARDSGSVFIAEMDRLDGIASQKAAQIGQNFQEELNRSFGIGTGGATSAGATFSALEDELNRLDAIATAKAAHIAQVTQQGINQSFGIGAGPGKSARDSAAVFAEAADAEDRMAASTARLRAAINPLEAEMTVLGKQMAEYRNLLNAGRISVQEFEQAQVMAAKRLSDVDMNLRKAATGGRVLSGEMANLGYQVNDVFTGIMLGQSPFMIFAQQGGQIYQIFQHSKASIGDFASSAMSWFGNLFTVARVAFGGIAAAIGISTVAANSFLTAQQKVALALTGAGRGSGSTVAGIGNIAQQGSSAFGLSVSEARELGTALAATGKIANDNILPIVKMGKDIEHAFGIEATDAAKMLAEAFADPAKGAETLNQRLGFLDASTKRNIDNLTAQNRVWDAQKVLLEGVKSGLDGVDEAISKSNKFWTLLGNSISNAWGSFGEFIARGTGAFETLEQRIDRTKKELDDLRSRGPSTFVLGFGDFAHVTPARDEGEISRKAAELDKLTAAYQRAAMATAVAQAAQRSFLQESTVRSVQADIAEREKLTNSLKVLQELLTSIGNDEAAGARLAAIGVTMKQVSDAVNILSNNIKIFKTDFEASLTNLKIANQAITAFTTAQKGQIAYQQSIESTLKSNMTDTEKLTLAQQAQANAVKQALTAITEAGRARELGAKQAVVSTQLDIDLIGQSIGKQAELRANLQARQALEQQASARHEQISAAEEAEYQRIKTTNAELGKRKQIEAEASALSKANFDLQTIFLSDTEKQIAAVNFQLHGNKWKEFMTDGLSSTLRVVDALKMVKDAAGTFASGLAKDLASGVPAVEALQSALKTLASSVLDAAVKRLVDQALSGLASALTGAAGGAVAGASQAATMTTGATTAAGILTTAGATVAASIIAGATEAASILGLTIPPAAATLPAAAAVAGTEVAAGGVTAGAAVTAGGVAVEGAAFSLSAAMGPIGLAFAAIAAAAAIFGLSGESKADKWLKDQTDGMNSRNADYTSRIAMAGVDTNTREGAIRAQDEKNIRERIAENKAGGQAMNALLQAQVREREVLLKEWDAKDTEIVKANADAKLAIDKAAADRSLDFKNRLFAATNDFETLEGQLRAFDRAAQQERVREMEAGGQAIVDLEAAQAAERYNVIKNFNDKTLEALNATAKGITDYVSGLYAGPSSTLSPTAQLAASQLAYNTKLALAQSGNAEAQSTITQDAENYRLAARAVFASGSGYQAIFSQITSQLLSLPAVQQTTDPVTQAVRDVLTAITIGNAALNTANTLTTNNVLPAVNAGNAANVAAALSAYFNQIDPSGKLASIVSSNASISAYGVNTAGNTATAADRTTATANKLDVSNSTLSAIQSLQSTATSQLQLLQTALNPASPSLTIIGITSPHEGSTTQPYNFAISNQMVVALNKIVWNTFATANNTRQLVTNGNDVKGTYATGGWITGGIPNMDSVRMAAGGLGMPGEFVVRHDIAQANKSWLPDFNSSGRVPMASFRAGNDNSTALLVAEVRALRAEVAQLRKENSEVTIASGNQVARTIASKADEQIGAIDESGRRTAYAVTSTTKDNKEAA